MGENLRVQTIRRLEDTLDRDEKKLASLKAELAGLPVRAAA